MFRGGLKFARGVLLVIAVFRSLSGAAQLGAAQSSSNAETHRREFLQRLVAAAVERTHHVARYEAAYVRIPYPGGDVPADTGVRTDEIIRTYRSVGVDLQKKFMRTCRNILSCIPIDGEGCRAGRMRISIIGAYRT